MVKQLVFGAVCAFLFTVVPMTQAQTLSSLAYDIGTPTLQALFVDPLQGNDANDGTTPNNPLQTVREAWRRIPMGETLTQGYHVWLMRGTYDEANLPTYWESRYGTAQAPIVIQALEGRGTAILTANVNVYDVHYFYWLDVDVIVGADAFHCELCTYLLLRGVTMAGAPPESYNARETLKVNQSQHIYVEDSDIYGAGDNAIDYVAVQYGHVVRSRVSEAGDWCMYAKGGSAYLWVEGNTFFNCGVGGFSAGQGTGFQFMVAPWLQYEAYEMVFINNLVHDTYGAAWGVQGGWKILIAHNTAWRVGERSHLVEVVYGLRSCDGQPGEDGRERCQAYLDAGGWGTTAVDDGDNQVRIPNKHVVIANNLIYNPAPYRSGDQHFTIFGVYENPAESNIPIAKADDALVIVNNIIWNGGAGYAIGVGFDDACADNNPTCNLRQLLADNEINTIEPSFITRDGLDVPIPSAGSLSARPIPPFVDERLPHLPAWERPSLPALSTVGALQR
jgi:hypothetical protein